MIDWKSTAKLMRRRWQNERRLAGEIAEQIVADHGAAAQLAEARAENERLREVAETARALVQKTPFFISIGTPDWYCCQFCLRTETTEGLHEETCPWSALDAALSAPTAGTGGDDVVTGSDPPATRLQAAGS